MKYELTFIHPSEHDSREHDSYTLKVEADSIPKSLKDFDGGTVKIWAGYQAMEEYFRIKADLFESNKIHLLQMDNETSVWDVWQDVANLNIGVAVMVEQTGKHFSSAKAKITLRNWDRKPELHSPAPKRW